MAADVLKPNKVPLFANKNINYQYFEVCLRDTAASKQAVVPASLYNSDVKYLYLNVFLKLN